MSYELTDLLKGLDDNTIATVTETIKSNSKELDAKVFIDGDGSHFVPHARFDEVIQQRDAANRSVTEQQSKLTELEKQVQEGSDAHAIIEDLQKRLNTQSQLAKTAVIESRLQPLITDSIAPTTDILGFMDMTKITVTDDGSVDGLEEQLKELREHKQYLFKPVPKEEPTDEHTDNPKGTGNPGSPDRMGRGAKTPKEVGAFGKQLAAALGGAQTKEQTSSYFK